MQGLNHWVEKYVSNADLVKEAENLLEQIQSNKNSTETSVHLLDLSIVLEMLGNDEYLNIQLEALNQQSVFNWNSPVYRTSLKFSHHFYDSFTGQSYAPALNVLVIKNTGSIYNNVPVECLLSDAIVENMYLGYSSEIDSNKYDACFVALAAVKENQEKLELLEKVANQAKFGMVNYPRDILKIMPDRLESFFLLDPYFSYTNTPSKLIELFPNGHEFLRYRVAVIEGVVFPYSIAISNQYVDSYESAAMLKNPKLLLQEKEILKNFELNEKIKIFASFKHLYERLGLNYFVVDFARTANHELFILDINVNMILHTFDRGFASYRQSYAEAIIDAFRNTLIYSNIK